MRLAPFRPFSFASRAFTRFAFFGNWLPCGLRRLGPVALRHGLSPVLPLVRQLAAMQLALCRPCSFASRAFARFALCGNWLSCGAWPFRPYSFASRAFARFAFWGGMNFLTNGSARRIDSAFAASFGDPPFFREVDRNGTNFQFCSGTSPLHISTYLEKSQS